MNVTATTMQPEPDNGNDSESTGTPVEQADKKIEWLSFWLPLAGVVIWLAITFLLFVFVLSDNDAHL